MVDEGIKSKSVLSLHYVDRDFRKRAEFASLAMELNNH